MVVKFPPSQTQLTRTQHAALASLLARSSLFAKPEPRSMAEEEALALLVWLGRAIGGRSLMIERGDRPWHTPRARQRHLGWPRGHGHPRSHQGRAARRNG